VDVDETPAVESFFAQLKEEIKVRFRQIEIWIVSHEIRRI